MFKMNQKDTSENVTHSIFLRESSLYLKGEVASVSLKQTLATSPGKKIVIHLKQNTAHMRHNTTVFKLA